MINQYPQYCNGGDLADYLNGKFSFAPFFIPLRKLNFLVGIWSFYWESLIFFSFSEGNIERRHNSAVSATIRWEDTRRKNIRLFQEEIPECYAFAAALSNCPSSLVCLLTKQMGWVQIKVEEKATFTCLVYYIKLSHCQKQ